MKVSILRSVASVALALNFSVAVAQATPDPELANFKTELQARYPYSKDSVVEPAFGDFYSVSKANEVLFVNKDLSIMISGNVFDLKAEKSLTNELLAKYKPKLSWDSLDLKKTIRIGQGPKKILVFSDPDCPFCQKLEAELAKLGGALTVYVAPFPLVGLHPNAQIVSDRIWCSKDKATAWRDYLLRQKQPAQIGCATPTNEWLEIGGKHGINSTPTIVLEDGTIIPGAQSAERIKQMVGIQ